MDVAQTHQAVLVTGDVYGNHFFETEIPLKGRVDKRGYEPARRRVNMDWTVNVLGDQKIIDFLGVFILASIGSSSASKLI